MGYVYRPRGKEAERIKKLLGLKKKRRKKPDPTPEEEEVLAKKLRKQFGLE